MTWFIHTELTNQCSRKTLFTCTVWLKPNFVFMLLFIADWKNSNRLLAKKLLASTSRGHFIGVNPKDLTISCWYVEKTFPEKGAEKVSYAQNISVDCQKLVVTHGKSLQWKPITRSSYFLISLHFNRPSCFLKCFRFAGMIGSYRSCWI